MKLLKMLGLAGVAATAMMAFVGAGTASATVLCKTTSTPCAEKYGAGTEINVQLKAGTVGKMISLWTTVECKKTTIKGKMSNTGGPTETVSGPNESVTAEECTCGGAGTAHVTYLSLGTGEIHHIAGTDDGTLTGTNGKITITCTNLGTSCIYGASSPVHLGVLDGGSPATFTGSATVPWNSGDSGAFVCGSTGKWEATYEVVSPKPLYVESS